MFNLVALLTFTLLASANGQLVGTLTPEVHPKLSWSKCVAGGTCTKQSASIVLDSNWRWTHLAADSTNCYDGSSWMGSACTGGNGANCAKACAIEGGDYAGTYGINANGDELSLKYVTTHAYGQNVGSRVYLMANDDTKYEMFKVNNREFTFDVDVSGLACGLNGALYFVEMDADGGLSKYPTNKAGSKYGTGYCDAQCPHDIKWINGEANVINWNPSATDPNAGVGRYGTCCPEMDIWEANNMATAYTPHPCSVKGQSRCDGASQCGDGDNRYSSICDKDGCDFNSYRMGNVNFYGQGKTLNTRKKMTVVTQFLTKDGTDTGDLVEIKRFYVQDGVVYANSQSTVAGVPGNSITDAFCEAQKTVFTDNNQYKAKGGLKAMGDSHKNGVVLVMSIWGDHAARMLWLDSSYPLGQSETKPGIKRGECAQTSGQPDDLMRDSPNATVKFSNIKFGPIGSTYNSGAVVPPTSSVASATKASSTSTAKPTSTTAAPAGAPLYGQCGGIGWTGPTTCAQGTCKVGNPYYSQCL